MNLEELARLRAAIEKAGDRDAVLRAERLTPDEWMSLQRHWLGAIATEISQGKHELSERYLAPFFGTPRATNPVVPAPPAPKYQVPTYLARAAAKPATSILAAPPSPALTPLHASTSEDFGSGPAIAPLAAILKPATPFQPGAAHVVPDRVAPAVRPQPQDDPIGSGTVIAATVGVAASSATPFANMGTPTPSPSTPASHDPFGSGTVIAPALTLPKAAVPFQQPLIEGSPRELPTLTVEQYAWVVAALRNAPVAELDATLSRLNLTREMRVRLDAAWSELFDREPAVAARFALAFAKHRKPDLFARSESADRPPPELTVAPSAGAGRGPATPFARNADEGMPLERYAEITNLLTSEGNPEATFRRLAINPAEWMATVRSFSVRFVESAELKAEFDRLSRPTGKR